MAGGEGQERCNIVMTSVHSVTVSGYLEGSVSRNKDVLTQLSPSSRAILTHFTFLHFAASFASFRSPLPLSGLTLRLLASLVCY